MKILVTGGAGYIGSHTVAELLRAGYEVVIFDNLIYGHKEAIKCPLVVGDLLKKEEINSVFKENHFDAVIHFAGYLAVGESMTNPAKYFENNIQGGVNLLEAMKNFQVNKIVFSSTCAIYGYPKRLPVGEDSVKGPISVYGESKLIFEKILSWYDSLFGIKSVCLRYFNAAGDSLDASIGEDKEPATNLIPLAMKAALRQVSKFVIFGDDYKTFDGTNVRDYIHVLDLAEAHIKALDYLVKEGNSNCFNVGTGNGYSVKQIVEMVKKISGVDFPVEIGLRRPGDPDAIYADNRKAKQVLGWEPKYSDLETIIRTAWNWHKTHPRGYAKINS